MPSVLEQEILFKIEGVCLDEKSETTLDDSESDYSDSTGSDDDSSYDSSDDDDDEDEEDDGFAWLIPHVMPRISSEPTLMAEEMTTTQVSVLINQLRTTQQQQLVTEKKSSVKTTKPPLLRRMSSRKGGGGGFLSIHGESMGGMMARRNSLGDSDGEDGRGADDSKSQASSVLTTTSDASSPQKPLDYLKAIFAESHYEFKTFDGDELGDFFQEITKDRTEAYSADMIRAVRLSDLDALRHMLIHENRRFDGCNKFGESILHTACRRGSSNVLRFLLEEAKIDVRVRDDYGRTPMHDACWTTQPKVGMIGLLMKAWPDLLLVKDKRGMTPLEYVREGQWTAWIKFMKRNQNDLLPKVLLQPVNAKNVGRGDPLHHSKATNHMHSEIGLSNKSHQKE